MRLRLCASRIWSPQVEVATGVDGERARVHTRHDTIDGNGDEHVPRQRAEVLCVVPAQGRGERRHADLSADAAEGSTGVCLHQVADERRTAERRYVGRRGKETDRSGDTINNKQ